MRWRSSSFCIDQKKGGGRGTSQKQQQRFRYVAHFLFSVSSLFYGVVFVVLSFPFFVCIFLLLLLQHLTAIHILNQVNCHRLDSQVYIPRTWHWDRSAWRDMVWFCLFSLSQSIHTRCVFVLDNYVIKLKGHTLVLLVFLVTKYSHLLRVCLNMLPNWSKWLIFSPLSAGGTAGAVITCPLEVVKTRLQSSGGTTLNHLYLNPTKLHLPFQTPVAQLHIYTTCHSNIPVDRPLPVLHHGSSRTAGIIFCLK